MALDKTINDRLLKIYGKDPKLDLQKYRVVWSETQTEKRYGSYDVLTQETGIWLGRKQGLVEIKKYWYLAKPCWLLERVEPNVNRADLFHDKFTYEPILTFLDKDNNRLELNWRAIEFLLNQLEQVTRKFLNEEDHRQVEEKKQEKESERVFGILDAPDPIKELPTFKTSTLLG